MDRVVVCDDGRHNCCHCVLLNLPCHIDRKFDVSFLHCCKYDTNKMTRCEIEEEMRKRKRKDARLKSLQSTSRLGKIIIKSH